MKLRNSDVFARPILRDCQEDFNTLIKAEFHLDTTRDHLELFYNIKLESKAFENYILEEKVSLFLHVYAQNIMYRNIIEIDITNLNSSIKFNRDEIYNKIEVSPILVAKEDFTLSAATEIIDSEDDNYEVKKGMILGYSETFEIEVDYSKTNLNDLVVIKPTTDKEQYHTIEIYDTITYYMGNEEYNSYNELYQSDNVYTKRLIKIVHNAIYTRLLYKVLESVENDDEEDFFSTNVYTFISQMFKSYFPNQKLNEIEVEDINKYAIMLSEISFVEITTEGEADE